MGENLKKFYVLQNIFCRTQRLVCLIINISLIWKGSIKIYLDS